MEFEDEHDEEQEEEEDDDEEEITIPPPSMPPSYDPNSGPTRPRVNPDRRSGAVRYRECRRNHAVNIGGHAVDGCGEFMPAGEEGTLDALKCAACNCHRNFHCKEVDSAAESPAAPPPQPPPHNHPPGGALFPQFSSYYRAPGAPPTGFLHVSQPPQRPLAVVPATSGGTHSGELDDMSHPSSSGGGSWGSKKRHRSRVPMCVIAWMMRLIQLLVLRVRKVFTRKSKKKCSQSSQSSNEDELKIISENNGKECVEICLGRLDEDARWAARVGCCLGRIRYDEESAAKLFRNDWLEEKKKKASSLSLFSCPTLMSV